MAYKRFVPVSDWGKDFSDAHFQLMDYWQATNSEPDYWNLDFDLKKSDSIFVLEILDEEPEWPAETGMKGQRDWV
jgi:hypothetical protein